MNMISMNVVTLLYLVASVCFIQALKGLSSPASARMGNAFGMTGMGIAVVTSCCSASWSAARSVPWPRSASR